MNDTSQIEAQGDCFEVHVHKLLEQPFCNMRDIRLCHGYVTGAKNSIVEGKAFVHCWLEHEGILFDFSNGCQIITDKRNLYSKGRILKHTVKKYTLQQVQKFILQHEHYGPWEEQFANDFYEGEL